MSVPSPDTNTAALGPVLQFADREDPTDDRSVPYRHERDRSTVVSVEGLSKTVGDGEESVTAVFDVSPWARLRIRSRSVPVDTPCARTIVHGAVSER